MEYGRKLLCERCYHLQVTGPEPPRTLSPTAFTVIAYMGLAAAGLAGFTLCVLYLVGTGDVTWFMVFTALMAVIVGCPALILIKKRNLSLIIASLYLPLGLWAFLWHLAPGAAWDYSRMTSYGGIFFFAVGLAALSVFIRDLRGLPRL